VVGSFVPGVGYRGKQGEAYSPLNHFIAELGEVEVSRLAWAFNLGLILSGISLIGASISLGLMLPGLLSKLGMTAGIICSIALALVGFFPMNKIQPHGHAAMTYFRSGLLMMLFFNLAIGLQQESAQVIPNTYSLAGLPAILSFASFLFLIQRSTREKDDNPLSTEDVKRPKIWPIAIVEWSIFITIVIWFLVIAVGL
jgi:hypothetical membrane protein